MKMFKLQLVIHFLCIILFIFSLKNTIVSHEEKRDEEMREASVNYVLNSQGIPNQKREDIIAYDMVLEIPKIKLKRGILKRDDKDNNIDKNVTILKASSYPDRSGNIYIAAHSGHGNRSYFNDLVKLKENDIANLYYQNKKYVYVVKKIKEMTKNSLSTIVTEDDNSLVLITCSQTDKTKYLIIILSKKTD